MSSIQSLRTLALTPDKVPDFLIPSRLPALPSRAVPPQVGPPDWDLTTCAAMSLQHVQHRTTPYGFRRLDASPCTARRESLFHKPGPGPERCRDLQPQHRPEPCRDLQDQGQSPSGPCHRPDLEAGAVPAPASGPGPGSSRSRVLRPLKVFSLQLMKLRRPAAVGPRPR